MISVAIRKATIGRVSMLFRGNGWGSQKLTIPSHSRGIHGYAATLASVGHRGGKRSGSNHVQPVDLGPPTTKKHN